MKRILISIALTCIAIAAIAQTTAVLTGVVTSEGKPLPGVMVTVTSPALQGARTAITGENGAYNFAALPPGQYNVRFELEGLSTVTKNADVQLSHTARADADMKITAAEAITVIANTPTVLETPQVATNIKAELVNKLPLARDPLTAASLAPGVNTNTLSTRQLSISGGPGDANLVMVNGVVITEQVRAEASDLFIEDAIQETTVLTGAVSAEWGRFTGGVVNTLTKSGGNEFTGSFRDSLTNPSWTAVSPFGEPKPASKLSSVYEATLGGYALRDRLWFFGAGRKSNAAQAFTTFRTNLPFTLGTDEKRFEGKLTGQIAASHNLVGSYLKIQSRTNNDFFITRIYDLNSLDTRRDPESLLSLHYNGVITKNLLIEGQYSKRKLAFIGAGSAFTDLIKGTLMRNSADGNARFNSPTFCGVCDPELRNNDGWTAKSSLFKNTPSLGNHEVVAGIEDFREHHFANNHQSGSDFRINVSDVVRVPGSTVPIFIDGIPVPRVLNRSTTYIRWTPIFVGANENNLETRSAFVNDRWDLSKHWTFNLGLRYDKNHSVDGNGRLTSNDSALSPRVTGIYDVKGNGKHRVTASFNRYVNKLSEGPATFAESSGTPGTIDFAYGGPEINPVGTPTDQLVPARVALQRIFDWFQANGGTSNLKLLAANGARSVPGFDFTIPHSLKSPFVDEYTLGYGWQIGSTGVIKADLISRKWRDFLAFRIDQSTPVATDQFGIAHDVALVENSNGISRTYRGVQLQSAWHPNRFTFGLNYTWSKLRGNDEEESLTGGNIGNTPLGLFYPEYLAFQQSLPIGYLPSDERHRARAWVSYDVPQFARLGLITLSALERYDSGLPYSVVASIDAFSYPGAPNIEKYTQSQLGFPNYFFQGRGNLRTDNITRTDLALHWTYPISRVQLFAHADLLNAFNQHKIANPGEIDTVVSTSLNSSSLKVFNPFTETPIECPQGAAASVCKAMGANYQKSDTFGQPTTKNAYQLPRTYRFSLGVRF